ncbi:hypothetical protein PG993_000254 [Apiospora rasikravindrae]|uniref:SMODS and SLOG-associating 2TM effector domain-containing protein n=1 Tax=Apiospora rasikravindrae TaxID=990691 RepID=A0ABR1U8I1_9PEZI
MSSFVEATLRLIFKRKPRQGTLKSDIESAATSAVPVPSAAAPQISTTLSSTVGATNSAQHLHTRNFGGNDHHQGVVIPSDDPLTMFRLMLGITDAPSLGFAEQNPVGTRPASNIGIYARVVHSEQKSKDSFKVFSTVINACYFLQIIVAAALTAMGAAGTSSQAITAFGAINTIIAGFLTFLKGSGLPGRLKYYGNEWKKIREYIEQRERDFSREGCTLDVHDVVNTVEKMYTHVKEEIEVNTPDGYTSVTNSRRMEQANVGKIGGFDMSKLEGIANKLTGLDGTIKSLKERVEVSIWRPSFRVLMVQGRAHGVTENIHSHEKQIEDEIRGFEKAIVKDVEDHKDRVEREVRERQTHVVQVVDEGLQTLAPHEHRRKEDGDAAL